MKRGLVVEKKGLSTLVTSLILILLVLVAVGILYSVYINFIKEGVGDVSVGKFTINLEVQSVVVNDDGTVDVNVKRNVGDGALTGIKFVVSDGVETEVIDKPTTIEELGSNIFSFTSAELESVNFIKEVSIAPIVTTSSGKESVGNEVDKVETNYQSCLHILSSGESEGDGTYTIDPDGFGNEKDIEVYCDMTTDDGGWTLVWVGTGKTYTESLIGSYSTGIDREDISRGTSVLMKAELLENWPSYTQVYYERWLPSSLTGRSYASPGWAQRAPLTVANDLTNMNFWSSSRTNTHGWDFSLTGQDDCGGGLTEPVYYKVCHQMPTGSIKRHIWSCWGCASNYLWFQNGNAWNGFFPDKTYGYWRITNSADYNKHWLEYDALSEGNQMPGYGLYVR